MDFRAKAKRSLGLAGLTALLGIGCSGELGAGNDSEGGSDPTTSGEVIGGGGTGPTEEGDATFVATLELADPLVRRLTKDELKYTLEDSLSIVLTDEDLAAVPGDRPLEGFVNVATSQTVLPDHVLAYAELAETIASRVGAEEFTAYSTCNEETPACRDLLVANLGQLLFRQPLSPEEVAAYASLFDAVAAEEGASTLDAQRAVLRALLQSPQFLYRIECETAASTGVSSGSERTVIGYEMASRLSYMVWASAPDQELLAAAEAGELDTPEGVLTQLRRMILDRAKAERVTGRYIQDWGRLEALPEDGGLKPELIESLIATYNYILWDAGVGPLDALAENQLMLTGTLAENYGLTKTSDDLALYDISGLPGRVGLLTHPGLIAGMTNADGGAIVARGLFLQTQLFCQETPSPPTSVQDAIDAFLEEMPEDASDRLIAETRLERPACGACHGGFDPLAYGLEQFDYQGRFRLADEHDNSLTTDGWIPGRVRADSDEDLPYANLEEYAELLAEEGQVSSCLTSQHLKYALGRVVESEAQIAVDEVQASFEAGGRSYQAMLEAIAVHALFRTMKVE